MLASGLTIPSPLRHVNACTLPHLVQQLNSTDIELQTLISAIRRTIANHDLLTRAWPLGQNRVIPSIYRDVVHIVFTQSNTKEPLDELITSASNIVLASDYIHFYILVGDDNSPSHLVLIAGPLFYSPSALLRVLQHIDLCCQAACIMPATDGVIPNPESSQIQVDSERYWTALLADFNSTPFTEPTRRPSASASLSVTTSCSDLGKSQLQCEDLRLTLLNAWAVVISHLHYAGSQDVVIAEALNMGDSAVYLVPRRVQYASTTSVHDQLAQQVAQDVIHAPFAWEFFKKVLGEVIHSIIEVHYEPEFSLFSTNQRSVFCPFDTPLHLNLVYTMSEALTFTLSFDPNVFVKQDVQYILDHLLLTFRQLFTNPALPFAEINLMSAEEQAFVQNLPSLVTMNGLTAPEDPACYHYTHELLLRQVSTQPDSIAIEYDGKPVYTYAELDAVSNQFAHYLKDHLSVRPGDVVVLFLAQSAMAVVAMYASFKVGAAYFAIDITTPPALFRKTADIANSSVIITLESLEPKLRTMCWGQTIVCVDQVDAPWFTLDRSWQVDECDIGDPKTSLAYLSVTSGSTGPPKRIMISHWNLVHWLVEAAPAFGRTTSTRQLQVSPLSYDGSVEEIFLTHYLGGTVCVTAIDVFNTSTGLHDALLLTKATSITISPSHDMQYLDLPAYPFLKDIIFTGEPLTRFVREKWLAHGKQLSNAFGPSETICGFALETPVRSSTLNETPAGFSVGGQLRTYILSPDMLFVPVGCVGEIYVSGPSVGLGYLGDPEGTARSFFQDPFRKEFRMYRTGDFGRVDYEGRLYFLGRRDRQIQLNYGSRVELAQTEAALHAAESQWLVIADVVTYQDQRHLAAFFAPHLASAPHSDLQLRLTDSAKTEGLRLFKFIEPKLLDYWCPTIWISLDALPISATGKMNRKLLKAFFHSLEPSLQDELANFVRPCTHFVMAVTKKL